MSDRKVEGDSIDNSENPQSYSLRERSVRFDYKQLHSTGERVAKIDLENIDKSYDSNPQPVVIDQRDLDLEGVVEPSGPVDRSAVMDEALAKEKEIVEDIDDHIEENPIDDSLVVVEDVDMNLSKIEDLRKQLKSNHNDIKKETTSADYTKSHEGRLRSHLNKIKEYILKGKTVRKQIRCFETKVQDEERQKRQEKEDEENAKKSRATDFLVIEVQRLIEELCEEFQKTEREVDDEELMRRYENLQSNFLKLDKLANKFQKTLELIPKTYDNKDSLIKKVTGDYNLLVQRKSTYEKYILEEVRKRELLKEKKFKTSCLNIKLGKFAGYDSDVDIYTFQSDFQKLFLKETPTKLLADLLKNNYLDDPALTLVKNLENIDEIWERLKKAYGDTKVLLNKKLATVRTIGALWKSKDTEAITNGLSNIIYVMTDLKKLAKKYKIENNLYHSDGINIIYQLLGDYRVTKFLDSTCESDSDESEIWTMLISFLEKELLVQQRKSIINQSLENLASKGSMNNTFKYKAHTAINDVIHVCLFCGSSDHGVIEIQDKVITDYFLCPVFVKINPLQRLNELKRKGFCFQCLSPGINWREEDHRRNCNAEFACNHTSHAKFPVKKHVLLCHEHKDLKENKETLEHYKRKCILSVGDSIPEYSKEIKLSFHASCSLTEAEIPNSVTQSVNSSGDVIDSGIFMFQTILVDGKKFNVFFDSGCGDFVCRKSSIQRIGRKALLEYPGPISLGGVGGLQTESMHGLYQVKLPLKTGEEVTFSGVCLDEITRPFPLYPINGQVLLDIQKGYKAAGGKISELPSLPDTVGGEMDFMVGIKYFRYYPEKVFHLPSGLTIYRSPFCNADGSDGVVGGPHQVFTEVESFFRQHRSRVMHASSETYISNQYKLFMLGYQVNIDVGMLHVTKKETDTFDDDRSGCLEEESLNDGRKVSTALLAKSERIFSEVENAGTEISYRCIDCRKCQKCLNSERTELISIKEEVEQDLIDKSVNVDVKSRVIVARLPLIDNPVVKLAPNKTKAMRVYKSQVRRLNKCIKDKEDVIASERKLQDLGYVDFVKNLNEADRQMLERNAIQNFIPWRAVWNSNSVTTPCRIVFDASQVTDSGYSLNSILAKGRNSMNKLLEVVLRWMMHAVGVHTDIQKMYNAIKLHKEDWCLQRYIWSNTLDIEEKPEEKVIKTLIYGVKPSGNQSVKALRDTARMSEEEFPHIKEIVDKDVYVDDCLTGALSLELAYKIADELTVVVNKGGFNLKGITFSGKPPLQGLSKDGESINVAGLKWFSVSDEISLEISELNFEKKASRKKAVSSICHTRKTNKKALCQQSC